MLSLCGCKEGAFACVAIGQIMFLEQRCSMRTPNLPVVLQWPWCCEVCGAVVPGMWLVGGSGQQHHGRLLIALHV